MTKKFCERIDPFVHRLLKSYPSPTKFLLIVHKVRNYKKRYPDSLEEDCQKCYAKVEVWDTPTWRESGVGLICDVCAQMDVGTFLSARTLDPVEVDDEGLPKVVENSDSIETNRSAWTQNLREIRSARISIGDDPWLLKIHELVAIYHTEGFQGVERMFNNLDRAVR